MLLELLVFAQYKLYIEGLILSLQIACQEATVSVHGSAKNSYIFYIKNQLISQINMWILKVFTVYLVLAIFASSGSFTGFEPRILLLIISSDKRNSFSTVKALHILPELGLNSVSREQDFLLFSVLMLQCNLCPGLHECIDQHFAKWCVKIVTYLGCLDFEVLYYFK